MNPYFLRRVTSLIPVLLLVLVLIFALARFIPGDPAVALLGPGATAEQIEALRGQMRLERSVPIQFLSSLSDLAHGDLGRSFRTGRPVFNDLLIKFPATLELSSLALVIAVVFGIPMGVLSAIKPHSLFDHATRLVSLLGVSMPAFLLALLVQNIFGVYLRWLPVSGRTSPYLLPHPVTGFAILDGIISGDGLAAWDAFCHLILPSAVLAAFLAATLARFIRNTMIEVMSEDYIRTARAKGLLDSAVIVRHGLRNSLLPALTVIGLQFAELLSGAILTETIFALPGIGRFMFDAIRNRDYPVIQGTVLAFALLFSMVSLTVDLLHGLLDPRIRKKMVDG